MICFWTGGPDDRLPQIPELADRLVEPGERLSAVEIKRLAWAASGRLGAVGLDADVRALEDGRLAVVLAPAWAELFLANLEAQAAAFKERLHRARCEAAIREAELRAQLEVSRRQVEVENKGIRAEYDKLVAAGLSHREAIRELKRLASGRLTASELSWIVPAKRKKAKPTNRRPSPVTRTPDSPDKLIRLWAETPAPTLARFEGKIVRQWWGWKQRRLSWRRAFAKRGRLPARVLWAAFSRDQAWHYLWATLRERHQYRDAKVALRTGCSPRTGIPLHPYRLRGFARDLEFLKSPWRSQDPGRGQHEAKRQADVALGLSWLQQRWLPEAEALAQLRAHGVTV